MATTSRLEPVITQVAPGVEAFDLWPVAPYGGWWLHVNGAMTPDQLGAVVRALVFYNADTETGRRLPATPAEALRMLTAENPLYAPGGLRLVAPASGLRADPGCCHDLFEWRGWAGALTGAPVYLGHGPGPVMRQLDGVIRVWVEVADDLGEPYGPYIDIPRAELPGMLRRAQEDLLGFLGALRGWAEGVAPELTDRFVTAVDTGLEITAPLPGG